MTPLARAAFSMVALLGALVGSLGAGAQAQAGERVVYYGLSNGGHPDQTFPFRVLKLALEESGVPYVLKPSPVGFITPQRSMEIMTAGGKIDIDWYGANKQADEALEPILFPIDGGLLGYRLFLIDGARQGEFDRVRTVTDLRQFAPLQGKGWADVSVLRKNGIRVRTASNREKIYKMTMVGRGDYFPRGAFEAFTEEDQFGPANPGMAVEKNLVLHYPLTFLFYVQKSNGTLHDDIYRGLMKAVSDGSYKRLFLSDPDIKTAIEKAQFKSRRILEIDNPDMPARVKAIDGKYWFHP
jgi:hypothetical protein